MTLTRWLAIITTLIVAWPANAQHRKTTLSPGGKSLIEVSVDEVRSCRLLYQWDRCHEPKRRKNAYSQPDPERRLKCIISSRNVAAKKGATHFTVKGALFSGYRCRTGAGHVERSGASLAAGAREEALGFPPWGNACQDPQELFLADCSLESTLQAQVSCRERRTRATMEATRVYHIASVKTRVDDLPDQGAFKVNVLGVLAQLGARSDQRYVALRPLMMARRGTATEALADAARPVMDVLVDKSALKAPKRFKRDLTVEALVRPRALHAPSALNPARIQVLEAELVGLRAYVKDLSWSKELVSPDAALPARACVPLGQGTLEMP